jgi:uncharacterized protein YcsI (UPF0317 family)
MVQENSMWFPPRTHRIVLPTGETLILPADPIARFDILRTLAPMALHAVIHQGGYYGPTSGLAPGFVQVNLVILDQEEAEELLAFAKANPRAIPVLEVLAPGNPLSSVLAPGANVQTMVPGYRLYENGVHTATLRDLRAVPYGGKVAMLIGCSFSFEQALIANGLVPHHTRLGRNVPMYAAHNLPTIPVGRYRGPTIVSARAYPLDRIADVVRITEPFVRAHGAPVFIGTREDVGVYGIQQGTWADLGIRDLWYPEYGQPIVIAEGDVVCFWACGVTPQEALQNARPPVPWALGHHPGGMLVTYMKDEDLGGGTVPPPQAPKL